MPHPYTTFRLRLARHAVAQLAARLRSSAEIVTLVLGPALLGLLAFAAMPSMLAAAEPVFLALPLLCLHGAAMSLPMLLLRPQVAPAHVRAWLQPLPLPPSLQRRACAAVAAWLTAPLALAYAASLAIWLYERPVWLLPLRAVAGTLGSLLLTWACATWLLERAGTAPHGPRRALGASAASATASATSIASAVTAPPAGTGTVSVPHAAPAGWPTLWHRLFWLPLWRNGSLAGACLGPWRRPPVAGTDVDQRTALDIDTAFFRTRAHGAGRVRHRAVVCHGKQIMGLTPHVAIERLAFHFKTRSVFLDLNLDFGPGLTWLRGRNGRGKTTLLKLLGGALAAASGTIRLDGIDSVAAALAFRRLSFYCGGEAPALDWLTAREWLELHLALYGDADRAALSRHLDAFRIPDIGAQPVTGLSLGQYKKLQLALALALPVRLLLIDEPFNGLDAQAVAVLEQALAQRAATGATCIVLTSHLDLRIAPTRMLDLDAQAGVV